MPIDVATEDPGDRVFLYFDTVSRYLDVPDFFEPKDPVGLEFCLIVGLNVKLAVWIISEIALDTWGIVVALTDTFTHLVM